MEEKEHIESIISELFKSTYNSAAAKALENGDEELAIKFLSHSNEMGIENDTTIKNVIGSNLPIVFDFSPKNINSKVDTGAETNSIHCTNFFVKDGVLHCMLLDHPETITFDDYKIKTVKSSNGTKNKRYCINLKFNVGGKDYESDFTLNNRDKMNYPVLLGKNFLNDNNFLVDVNEPYLETVNEGRTTRLFNQNLDDSELVWHRDKEDRIVFPLHETDWKFQFNDELPINIEPNKPIFIESKKFHRLIKGTGDLEVEIYKTNLDDETNLKSTISEIFNLFLEERGKSSRTKKGRKVPGKYLTAKSEKKRSEMKKEIDKFASKHHSDPSAYIKQWQADKGQKTKESPATKAYKKMFGEGRISDYLKNKKENLKSGLIKFKEAARREGKETSQAYDILKKIITKKDVSKEELDFLKAQSKDLAKILATLSLSAVSTVLPIAIEKALQKSKYNISILPKDNSEILNKKEDENLEQIDESKKAKQDNGLKGKSKSSKIPYYILKQVYNRGMAAWRTGHRPGVAQNQWAMGRVNSFITGSGGSRKADSDLWKKAKAAKKKKIKSKSKKK